MKSLRIGDVKLKNRLFLAPMVDVTDLPYRLLCREQGASIAYTEMINIGAILHENKKTLDMMKTSKKDNPLGIQITGNNELEFKKVIPFLDNSKFDLVDINCGCPSSRIVGNESGSYLLNHPEKIGKMIKVLKNSGLPVTVKIRLGFKKDEGIKISKTIEKAGADLLTVHGRLASQRTRDPVNLKSMINIKNSLGIPVVANGGVVNGETASNMLDDFDGVMIAGAAMGNPYIFRESLRYLRTGKEKEITKSERVRSFKKYFNLAKKNDLLDLKRIKFLGGYFLRGFEGAASNRKSLMELKEVKDFRNFLHNI